MTGAGCTCYLCYMSSAEDGKGAVEASTTIIVKGGTTSSRYDREMARRKQSAERRRKAQDDMYRIRAEARERGEMARIGTQAFINEASPRLVLHYMNRDGTIRQDCKSEITMVPKISRPSELEATFALVCPRCLARDVPMGEAQMLVREGHRPFTIREERNQAKGLPGKGDVVMLEYGWGVKEPVMIAGTVSCHDIIRCNNVNCDYAVRIEDSKVWEV